MEILIPFSFVCHGQRLSLGENSFDMPVKHWPGDDMIPTKLPVPSKASVCMREIQSTYSFKLKYQMTVMESLFVPWGAWGALKPLKPLYAFSLHD